MSAAGYRMRYAGKAHLGWERGAVEYGFDSEEREFDKAAYQRDHRIRTEQQGGRAKAERRERTEAGHMGLPRCSGCLLAPLRRGGCSLRKQRRRRCRPRQACNSCRALADESSDQPWCLWMNFTGPHNPYIVPREYAERFDWRDVPVPPSFYTDAPPSDAVGPQARLRAPGEGNVVSGDR